ncbi:MAG TPA: TolC family protein [Vicinamibacteria bacterium]|nr:TolC family protein [Vicinamibacteria bacterium]
MARRLGAMLLASPLSLGAVFAQETAPAAIPLVVAVVRDGPPTDRDFTALVESEIERHLPDGVVVRFDRREAFDARWLPERVSAALAAALVDPDVDIVLADGLRVTLEAAREGLALPKPVVSTYLQFSDVFRFPYDANDRSLKENLSFTVLPHRAEQDLAAFREMLAIDSVTVVVGPSDLELLPEIASVLEQYESTLGIDVRFADVEQDVDAFLASQGAMEAAYLTRLPRLGEAERTRLIAGLTNRGVPTFSLVGHPDVSLGALAALIPDVTEQHVRRIALNVARLARGETTRELPVLLTVDERLMVNARTALIVGYVPSLETRIFASILHEDEIDQRGAEPLTPPQALEQAALSNKFLSVQDEIIESIRQEQFRARSSLLPRAISSLGYRQTNLLQDVLPDDATTFGLSVKQMLFDDGAISSYRSSQRVYEGSEFQREADRIAVLGDAGTAFYGLAVTQALYAVQADNLRLSESFLELARLRREVGYSGMDEIYRWQAAVAQRRSALFVAAEDSDAARITLNRVLGTNQERRWLLETPPIDPDVFPFVGGELDPIFDDLKARDALGDVLVDFAVGNAPDVEALDMQIESIDIGLAQSRRRFYVPSAYFNLFYNRLLTGASNNLAEGEKGLYVWSISLDYPLFEGGLRQADVNKASAERRVLERQRELQAELIEQQTRTSLSRVDGSFPRIRFAQQAAEAADNNLRIVQDKYAEGVSDVTDLISAQNEKLTADQAAAAAEFEFWINLVELQRALSWFEDEKSPEQRAQFVEEIRRLVGEREGEPR